MCMYVWFHNRVVLLAVVCRTWYVMPAMYLNCAYIVLLPLLLLCCYDMRPDVFAGAVAALLLLFLILCRMEKSCCLFIESDSSVLFLCIQTRFTLNVPLGSTGHFHHFLRPRLACEYILGNYGHAWSKGGRQPAAAKPPLYIYVGLVHKKHIIRTRLMYHAACKVEFQPFKRWYSQLTFFNFLHV